MHVAMPLSESSPFLCRQTSTAAAAAAATKAEREGEREDDRVARRSDRAAEKRTGKCVCVGGGGLLIVGHVYMVVKVYRV